MLSAADNLRLLQLAQQYFTAQDPRFLDTLRSVHSASLLAPFADRWVSDPRSWARAQMFDYLALAPNSLGHQSVVKRLFKGAEAREDDQLMGAFAVYFDQLVRHTRRVRTIQQGGTEAPIDEEYLAPSAPMLPAGDWPAGRRSPQDPSREGGARRSSAVYFSYATRYYLQRRAWRYFRRLASRDRIRYLNGVVHLLARYQDDHFTTPEHLLDARTLLQGAFRHHPALEFGRERVRLAESRSLEELRAAPSFPEHWQSREALACLLYLLESAQSRLVRVWAIQVLEQWHRDAVAELPVVRLLELLVSPHTDVHQFAAEQLQQSTPLGEVPLSVWWKLLEAESPVALEALGRAMREHVAPERLDVAQCVWLACRQTTAIAQLGFDVLQTKPLAGENDLVELARLADTRCAALAAHMAQWALQQFAGDETYHRDAVVRFFDSRSPEVRAAACDWLGEGAGPVWDDPVLFTQLMETPYSEVRLRLVELLEARTLPADSQTGLPAVWERVLLGIERGGRQKLMATRQLAEQLQGDPAQADRLLPVLAAAVRSVRRPESRAGLAAVVASLAACPELTAAVERHLPELEIVGEVAP